MKSAFEISETKRIAPFTIINLSENEKEQKRKWANFYDEKMIHYCNSFEESMLWKNPRLSLETFFDAILQQKPRKAGKAFKKFTTLEELHDFVKTITKFDIE